MSITHVFINDRAAASDNPLPTSLSPDAQSGKLASITVTLGAGVTTITLADWASGVIISPVTDSVRFAVDEDPAADATSSATTIAAAALAVGATAPDLGATEFASADTTPPVISGLTATGIGATTAEITWVTDELATDRVFYDTVSHPADTDGTAYASSTSADATADHLAHAVPLSGLTPETVYSYKVRSADAAGNIAFSAEQSFTTAQPPVAIPPGHHRGRLGYGVRRGALALGVRG